MSSKLKLLLTNDDGIEGPGLKALTEALREIADVYVLAPETNRSAVSSHIVMFDELKVIPAGKDSYKCTGYPSDCVISALRSNLFGDIQFDAVVSGINKGANMGTDCIYSGTVAAARQAVLYGVPGIAVSLKSTKNETTDFSDKLFDYTALARFIALNIEKLISLCEKNVIVSVNALSISSDNAYKGVRLTSLCIRDYKDKVELEKNSDGSFRRIFVSGKINTYGPEDNEYDAVNQGYVAVTRLYAEPVSCPVIKDKHLVEQGFEF